MLGASRLSRTHGSAPTLRRGPTERRDLGDYAQLGLWLLDGMEEGAARATVKTKPWGKAADFMFDKLLRAAPGALQERDRGGIIETLEKLGLCPPRRAERGTHAVRVPEAMSACGSPSEWRALRGVCGALARGRAHPCTESVG